MSVSTIKTALAGLITGTPALSSKVKTVRTVLPNFEREVLPAPWCLVMPGTLQWDAEEAGDNQLHGPFTIGYFDDLADDGQNNPPDPGPIYQAAEDFTDALRTALKADWTIGGQVISAGKEDFGVLLHFAEAGAVKTYAQRPLYFIPLDVYVRDYIG